MRRRNCRGCGAALPRLAGGVSIPGVGNGGTHMPAQNRQPAANIQRKKEQHRQHSADDNTPPEPFLDRYPCHAPNSTPARRGVNPNCSLSPLVCGTPAAGMAMAQLCSDPRA